MNSLMSYGSDDDCDSSEERHATDSYSSSRGYRKPGTMKQDDANYDEVQMSLSEDSGDETKPAAKQSASSTRRWDVRESSKSNKDDSKDRKESSRYSSKSEREEERPRERHRDEERHRDDRRKSRDRHGRDDRYKDRKERDRRRSRSPRDSRERRRSRSPRRERTRSRSRDRSGKSSYSKRFDRANKDRASDKTAAVEAKPEESAENKDRFFVPGITGRFRDQIEKRKLLWQKKEPEAQQVAPISQPSVSSGGSRTTKVWETTTFAQDTDGKVANKFKRLMGIKNMGEGSNSATDVLKKQEEMFSSMEQQYEVARTATHTMRGVGLGFGSYQR